MTDGEAIEKVAKLIDPSAWANDDPQGVDVERRVAALMKAAQTMAKLKEDILQQQPFYSEAISQTSEVVMAGRFLIDVTIFNDGVCVGPPFYKHVKGENSASDVIGIAGIIAMLCEMTEKSGAPTCKCTDCLTRRNYAAVIAARNALRKTLGEKFRFAAVDGIGPTVGNA
jgi:hypothetical protein